MTWFWIKIKTEQMAEKLNELVPVTVPPHFNSRTFVASGSAKKNRYGCYALSK